MERPMTNIVTTNDARVRVRYAETDQMGVVYHSNYIIWFEVGRVELLRAMGHTYREMEADDIHLPVVEVRCRYKQPARYDDDIVIRTSLKNARENLIHFHYQVMRAGDEQVLAEGESVHLVMDSKGRRRRFSDKYLGPFKAALQSCNRGHQDITGSQ
jgi:acyl-CoA thioester hydrolase